MKTQNYLEIKMQSKTTILDVLAEAELTDLLLIFENLHAEKLEQIVTAADVILQERDIYE